VIAGAVFVVTAAYFVASWSGGVQAIGIRVWRTHVATADGCALPWPQSLLRFAIALLSSLALGLGFLLFLVDRERRGWHDLAGGSHTLRAIWLILISSSLRRLQLRRLQ